MGFILGLPDYNPALRRGGHRWVEAGWILEENAVTRRTAERWGGRVVKRYRIYEGPV